MTLKICALTMICTVGSARNILALFSHVRIVTLTVGIHVIVSGASSMSITVGWITKTDVARGPLPSFITRTHTIEAMAVIVAGVGTVLLHAAVISTPAFITVTTIILESYPSKRIRWGVTASVIGTVVEANLVHRILTALSGVTTVTVALKVEAVAMERAVV